MTEIFNASAQYNDWQGNAAADDLGNRAIRDLLRERNLLTDGEFLVGIDIWMNELHAGLVVVQAYLIEANDYEEAQAVLDDGASILNAKKVSIEDLTVEQFFGLFKRFNVALSWQNTGLIGREINTDK